jgi:uncharacterized protein (UPF0548 family)
MTQKVSILKKSPVFFIIFIYGCAINNPFLETNLKSRNPHDASEKKIFVTMNHEWTRLLGISGAYTYAKSITSDKNGFIYIAGTTYGNLDGQILTGSDGLFVIKYDANGDKLWTRLLGVSGVETWCFGIASDAKGNLYVTGTTYGDLDGKILAGSQDSFVVKYDSNGNKRWTVLTGAAGSYSCSYGITTDQDGNIYSTGSTSGNLDGSIRTVKQDIFVTKFDANGNRIWIRQLGVAGCYTACNGIISDASGNVYASGTTDGNLDGRQLTGSNDLFVVKYDSNGDKQWTRLLGVSMRDARAFKIASDTFGNIYATGTTNGGLDGQAVIGTTDSFIVKYDQNGDRKWTRLFGISGSNAISLGISSDIGGNVFITGYTENLSTGIQSLFEARYGSNGDRQNIFSQESSDQISGQGILTDSDGYIYITGSTTSDFHGLHVSGKSDLFLMKYGQNVHVE